MKKILPIGFIGFIMSFVLWIWANTIGPRPFKIAWNRLWKQGRMIKMVTKPNIIQTTNVTIENVWNSPTLFPYWTGMSFRQPKTTWLSCHFVLTLDFMASNWVLLRIKPPSKHVKVARLLDFPTLRFSFNSGYLIPEKRKVYVKWQILDVPTSFSENLFS